MMSGHDLHPERQPLPRLSALAMSSNLGKLPWSGLQAGLALEGQLCGARVQGLHDGGGHRQVAVQQRQARRAAGQHAQQLAQPRQQRLCKLGLRATLSIETASVTAKGASSKGAT